MYLLNTELQNLLLCDIEQSYFIGNDGCELTGCLTLINDIL